MHCVQQSVLAHKLGFYWSYRTSTVILNDTLMSQIQFCLFYQKQLEFLVLSHLLPNYKSMLVAAYGGPES